MHFEVAGSVGLEIEGHFPGHVSEVAQQVFVSAATLKDVTKGLDEPGPGRRVPPRVKARNGAVGDQKVSVRGDLVGHGGAVCLGGVAGPFQVDAVVQLIALASLDEEQLGFAGQRRTVLGVEWRPQAVRFVRVVSGVQDSQLAVAQHGNQDAVRVGMIFQGRLLKDTIHIFPGQIFVNPYLNENNENEPFNQKIKKDNK